MQALCEKLEKLERENLMLRRANESSNDVQQKHINQIRKLTEEVNEY